MCEIRRELMDYPTYQQQGWPIGSGSVESSQHQRVREQQAKRRESPPPPLPVPAPPKPTRQKTGRTEAQYRWGRRTFSPRMLKQADGAKK